MKNKGAKKTADDIKNIQREHRILDEINRRAYELWEESGYQHGCDVNHWLQAEQEVREAAREN